MSCFYCEGENSLVQLYANGEEMTCPNCGNIVNSISSYRTSKKVVKFKLRSDTDYLYDYDELMEHVGETIWVNHLDGQLKETFSGRYDIGEAEIKFDEVLNDYVISMIHKDRLAYLAREINKPNSFRAYLKRPF